MSSAEKWHEYKLSELKRLEGLVFTLRAYQALTEEWDHDHCVGCGAKFSEVDRLDAQREGYMTSVPDTEPAETLLPGVSCIREPTPGGFALRWVCRECFAEFRDVLGFRV